MIAYIAGILMVMLPPILFIFIHLHFEDKEFARRRKEESNDPNQ